MRTRERQKRLDKEYTIESNCIKREREKLDTIWICNKGEREKDKRNWAKEYFYCIIISV